MLRSGEMHPAAEGLDPMLDICCEALAWPEALFRGCRPHHHRRDRRTGRRNFGGPDRAVRIRPGQGYRADSALGAALPASRRASPPRGGTPQSNVNGGPAIGWTTLTYARPLRFPWWRL